MSISRLAPIDLDIDDSMLVAVQQILWFKENGFTLSTVRSLTFLPADPKATWDQTCEELAEIWESIRHAENTSGKAQADHRQVSVGFRRTSEGAGQEVSEQRTDEPLCSLWIGNGGDSSTHQDREPGWCWAKAFGLLRRVFVRPTSPGAGGQSRP